jgi:F-type H+-transporting ATPase subunit epsilon
LINSIWKRYNYQITMQVEIATPEAVLFSGEADSVSAIGAMGGMGILNNHTPLLSSLLEGRVRIDEKEFEIKKGFLKVSDNRIIIITEGVK